MLRLKPQKPDSWVNKLAKGSVMFTTQRSLGLGTGKHDINEQTSLAFEQSPPAPAGSCWKRPWVINITIWLPGCSYSCTNIRQQNIARTQEQKYFLFPCAPWLCVVFCFVLTFSLFVLWFYFLVNDASKLLFSSGCRHTMGSPKQKGTRKTSSSLNIANE